MSVQQRFAQLAVDTVLDAVITTRAERIVVWNDHAERLFGWSADEALGRTLPETIVPHFRIGAYRAVLEDLKHEGPNASRKHREGFAQDRTGRVFPVEVSSAAMEVGAERIVSHFIRDISERKEAEDALRDSNQLLQALLDSLPVAITVTDADGLVRVWNRAAEEMFGWSADEVIETPLPTCPPDRVDEFVARRVRVFAGETLTGFRAEAMLRDGARIAVNVTATPVYGPDGAVSASMAIIEDLTEQQRAAAEIRETNQLLNTLLDASPLPITAIDVEGRTTLWNPAAERDFGWTSNDVLGRPLPVFPAEDGAGSAARRDLVHSGRTITDANVRGVRRDGSRLDLSLSAAPIHGPDGGVRGSIEIMMDVTERLHAFELLRRSDEERRRLLAKLVRAQEEERRRIAADIHDDSVQVLTALALRLELLRRKTDDPGVLESLAEAETTARLAITRLRHLMFELRPPALDRDGLAAAVRLQLEQIKRDNGIDYVFEDELDAEPEGESRAVAYRIAQEALVNVVKHADASTVRVRLGSRGGGVFAQVADDGRGFDQAAEPVAHFGLVAMRERAEMAGGRCRIRAALGRGTVVQFFVPNAVVQTEQAA
jgi:PAS domain S-box-containing protein